MQYKKVLMGVAAAGIGAAIFGAIHFMFLAPQFGSGDFFGTGISMAVIMPIILGLLGFIVGIGYIKKEGPLKDIVLYGSAASIGFGVAEYIPWVAPTKTAAASVPRYVPAYAPSTPTAAPSIGSAYTNPQVNGFTGSSGTMLI